MTTAGQAQTSFGGAAGRRQQRVQQNAIVRVIRGLIRRVAIRIKVRLDKEIAR